MIESKENKFTPELIAKARRAKSSEELIALAEENGITITQDEARDYFAQLNECNQSGELSDDELDNVSGGGCCYYGDGRLVVTFAYYCERYQCKHCGKAFSPKALDIHTCNDYLRIACDCGSCEYKTNKGIRMLCNHPENYKK